MFRLRNHLYNNVMNFARVYSKEPIPRCFQTLDGVHGLCVGLAVSYGEMSIAGHRKEWQQILRAMANWDSESYDAREKLDEPLMELEQKTSEKKSDAQPRTLRTCFEDFLKTVLVNHDKQEMLLDPTAGIEILFPLRLPQSDGTVKYKTETVKHRATLAGHFDDAQLAKILDAIKSQNAICVVSTHIENMKHACHLSFNSDTSLWELYDSMNDHRSVKTMVFSGSQSQVIEKIRTDLGSSLKFTIASLDPHQVVHLPKYEELLATSPSATFVSDYGLFTLLSAPESLTELLTLAEKNEKLRHDLTTALTMTDHDYWADYDKYEEKAADLCKFKYPKYVFLKLSETDRAPDEMHTGFHELAIKQPKALQQLYGLAQEDLLLRNAIFQHFSIYDSRRFSFFDHAVVDQNSLPILVELAAQSEEHSEALSQALKRFNHFEFYIWEKPENFRQFVKIAEKNEIFRDLLVLFASKTLSIIFLSSNLIKKLAEDTCYGEFIELAAKKPQHLFLLTYLIDDTTDWRFLIKRLQKVCNDKTFVELAEKNDFLKEFSRKISDAYHKFYPQETPETKHEEEKTPAPRTPVVESSAKTTPDNAEEITRPTNVVELILYGYYRCRRYLKKDEQTQSTSAKSQARFFTSSAGSTEPEKTVVPEKNKHESKR